MQETSSALLLLVSPRGHVAAVLHLDCIVAAAASVRPESIIAQHLPFAGTFHISRPPSRCRSCCPLCVARSPGRRELGAESPGIALQQNKQGGIDHQEPTNQQLEERFVREEAAERS